MLVLAQLYLTKRKDLNPGSSLLSGNLPLPLSARANHSQATIDLAFTNFNAALKQRRGNRTPLLDAVISTVENQLRELKSELESTATGGFAKGTLLIQFGPLEDQFGTALVRYLDEQLDRVAMSQDDADLNLVVFVGRVAGCLSTSAPFVEDKLGSRKSIEGLSLRVSFPYLNS